MNKAQSTKHEEPLYPLLFHPVYKDYIWGGRRIPEHFARDIHQDIVAESWEISERPEGMSLVRNGALAGMGLGDLVRSHGRDILGTACPTDRFPLLIKIIDAAKRLSVQVHPHDDNAADCGGEPKTEMWYALGGDANARVFAGLSAGTTPDSFRQALDAGTLESVLNALPLAPGQAIYIPGGRVHAIAEGCLLLEVQQNSNTTYRVYDWGRVGHDGKPRDLHIEEAFQVINWNEEEPSVIEPRRIETSSSATAWEILKSPYFHLTRWDLSEALPVQHDATSFHALFTLSGKTRIEAGESSETISPGTSCLIPACLENYRITPVDGSASHIRITL